MQTKFLIINNYITFANPTSYYSSFIDESWEQSEFMSWSFLLHCLEMDQCNGICELNHLSSEVHERSLHGWTSLFAYSFSKHLLRTVSVLDAGDKKVNKTQDRTSFNTQRVSWLAENHYRFQHDWAQCTMACGCQRGKKSWTDELVSFLNG